MVSINRKMIENGVPNAYIAIDCNNSVLLFVVTGTKLFKGLTFLTEINFNECTLIRQKKLVLVFMFVCGFFPAMHILELNV